MVAIVALSVASEVNGLVADVVIKEADVVVIGGSYLVASMVISGG